MDELKMLLRCILITELNFLYPILGQLTPIGMLVSWFVILPLTPVFLIRLFRRLGRKRSVVLSAVIAAAVAGLFGLSAIGRAYHQRPPQFTGGSELLQKTQIVPTLDTPIEPGKNVIWCASFQAAWKRLQTDIAKEPVRLSGAESIESLLNAAPEPEAPEGDLYAAAGWEDQGIVETIRKKKAELFPGSATPEFPGIVPGSFVAYAYLQSKCTFPIPYFDSVKPLEFHAGDGTVSGIRTFGIREKDEYGYNEIRKQVGVLFGESDHSVIMTSFALDLCKDSPSVQVVFARTTLGKTLGDTLAAIDAKISANENRSDLGCSDIVLVPEIAFDLEHHFLELEKRTFSNAGLEEQRLDVAQQDIAFRLDRSGAELMSEAKMYVRSAGFHYIGDGPFLVYLKKRGAAQPYFVLWVDNDELLTKW